MTALSWARAGVDINSDQYSSNVVMINPTSYSENFLINQVPVPFFNWEDQSFEIS